MHIVDIPATMLALYDIPTPDGFDGNPANACLSENRLKAGRASTPCKKTPGKVRQELSTAEEEEEIKDKLKSLGYM